MRGTRSATSLGVTLVWLGLYVAVGDRIGDSRARADSPSAKPDAVAAGAEIFNREWMPNDPRSHGGDGLGPVYNDTSCVACHNSGGSGGGGPVGKNIDILSASLNGGQPVQQAQAAQGGSASPSASAILDPLAEVHAGFRTSRTVVLHKFGTDPNYDSWRSRALNAPAGGPNGAVTVTNQFFSAQPAFASGAVVFDSFSQPQGVQGGRRQSAEDPAASRAAERMQQIRAGMMANGAAGRQALAVGQFLVTRSQRNPTALFGLGLIDAIPEAAIEAMAKKEAKESPEIQGRVSRVKDGRIGRLGWKGQMASVEDIVLNACAVELGLEVPGHHQAISPQAPKYRTTGLDLTAEECNALVAYVRSLPKPAERRPSGRAEAQHIDAGKATFASIGCAGCHAERVGDVVGIFSDLLLHDMGQELGDEGSYGDSADDGSDEPLVPRLVAQAPTKAPAGPRGANRREWRTPPLWGFRDSGPYLHDGRAQTLEEAVALHGGQGAASAQKFMQLAPRDRLQVEAFLKSLTAPTPRIQLAQRGD
jgi:CxxC motif-containing protein (DUF1111 family)